MNRTLSGEYLTITAICDSEVSFNKYSPTGYLYYRKNSIWRKYSEKLVLLAGESVQFKGELIAISNISVRGCGKFTITGGCNISGYCDSILRTINAHCFAGLFEGCDIIDASCLILPVTTLVYSCYENMFTGCTKLTTAPELPATTLVGSCYENMFTGCANLNYIKMLATDISAEFCLHYWVDGVASTGTFVKNAAMTSLPTDVSGIPSGWTVVDA